MSLTNSQVAERFNDRRKGNGLNISTNGTVIKSYNAVIAQWLSAENNLQGHKPIVLLNGDRYSVTSSQHLGAVRFAVSGERWDRHPTVSFSALNAAGLAFGSGWSQGELRAEVRLVDYQEDLQELVYEDNTAHRTWGRGIKTQGAVCFLGDPRYNEILKSIPIGATPFDRKGKWVTPRVNSWGAQRGESARYYEKGYRGYHRAGTVVLRYEGHDYLCGLDEQSYFVSQLPHQVNSVEEAYAALLPPEVQDRFFLRQGEWFFVEANPQALMQERYPLLATASPRFSFHQFKKMSHNKALPRTTERSNPHVVTYLVESEAGTYAAGTVRHPEHRMLRLEPGKIYQAFRNRSLGDWSSQGYRVD